MVLAPSVQQVSKQGIRRISALSGHSHIRLSMADNSGDAPVWGDPKFRVSTRLQQASKAKNTNPIRKRTFMPANVGKLSQYETAHNQTTVFVAKLFNHDLFSIRMKFFVAVQAVNYRRIHLPTGS